MRRILDILRILSIDVVLGAWASGGMVIWWLECEMPLVWWTALPLSVWVIYTTDHLMDAYRLQDRAHTARHLFHHQYFRVIGIIWIICLIGCVALIPWFLTQEILLFGCVMGMLVLVHLGLVRIIGNRISWLFHKELGVGLIYASGIWGAPILSCDVVNSDVVPLLFIQFLLLALINLLVFSAYEWDTDELDGHTSFVRAIGLLNTRKLIGGMMLIIMGLGIVFLISEPATMKSLSIQGTYLTMLVILLLISFFPNWFTHNERYRVWGDAVFIFPSWLWLM